MRTHPKVSAMLWNALAVALAVSACGGGDSGDRGDIPVALPDSLRVELIEMGRQDQLVRVDAFVCEMTQDLAVLRELEYGDSVRSARLREIVQEYGWPDSVLAGIEAARAAFLILQHSPDRDFQRAMVAPLEEMARRGAMPRSEVALLIDRVLTNDGKPQRYGTQFTFVDSGMMMWAVEDAERLDDLRRDMGLLPMDVYIELLEDMYNTTMVGVEQQDDHH